jgi:peptidyl-prolyl cis-trans isomerase C
MERTGWSSLLALTAAAVLLAGCGRSEPQPTAPPAGDTRVAAMVNGTPIYAEEVRFEAEAQGVIQPGETLEEGGRVYDEVLDQMIDVKLLALEAEARALDADPEARHRLNAAREHILGNILIETIVAERVDEASVRKMYDAQIEMLELGEEVRLRHIVMPTRAEIEAVAAQLAAGADFAVLAAQKSSDEGTRLEGGDLGFVREQEAPPEFAEAIRATKAGSVSRPFQTEMGWHVVRVEERRPEPPPGLEELRGPILKHLSMMQISEVLKELRVKAKIDKIASPRNSSAESAGRRTEPTERGDRGGASPPQDASGETAP